MGIILIMFFVSIVVVLFQMAFTQMETKHYKKIYYELISNLSENHNDTELKNKAIDAGNEYYSRIKVYRINFKGVPMPVIRGTMDEKIFYEDMIRIVGSEKNHKH